MARLRIAFDLDETLGVPLIDRATIVGFQCRPGCLELLARLRSQHELLLWSVGGRRYVDRCLAFGLGDFFTETYTWDELPVAWKHVNRIRADLLVDDSPQHREGGARAGLGERYVLIPAYGSPEDCADPLAWVRLVEQALVRLSPAVAGP